jgi:hypothetical protein
MRAQAELKGQQSMKMQRYVSGRRNASQSAACALGWFSIGLGLAELLAPRLLGRLTGMQGREGMIRACGAREIGTGIGLLWSFDRAPWVWGRVAGDAIDLAGLAAGLARSEGKIGPLAAIGAVAGVTLADIATAQVLSELREKDRKQFRDYSDRSGMPRPAQAMRGAVREVKPAAERRSAVAPRRASAAPS